jgi:hypothetical protein
MVMNHLAHILRDWDAFLVRLSRVDESSQSGTSFPESGTSFEDVIMHHVAPYSASGTLDWKANAFS